MDFLMMKKIIEYHDALTQEELKKIIVYYPESGLFVWNKSMANGRLKKGSIAGSIICKNKEKHSNPYVVFRLKGIAYQGSHLAHLYMTGKMPSGNAKYLNGNTIDNSWKNLSFPEYNPKKEPKQRAVTVIDYDDTTVENSNEESAEVKMFGSWALHNREVKDTIEKLREIKDSSDIFKLLNLVYLSYNKKRKPIQPTPL